jgi:protein gp37
VSRGTEIAWTEATWNPIIGCDRVGPGCDSCYAIGQSHMRASHPNPKVAAAFAGTTHRTADRIDWTGQVNLLPDRLTEPLAWRKPTRIFVNSLADLFHEDVPDEFIARVFAVMAVAERHTFQVLTKRHGRMKALLNNQFFRAAVRAKMPADHRPPPGELAWPLSNVWMGVSVENQKWADIRIPALLETPAAVRWISAEPLLGPLDLGAYLTPAPPLDRLWCPTVKRQIDRIGTAACTCRDAHRSARLGWIVAGGESGPKARPPHPDWFRRLRNQCDSAHVPFLLKQWGTWGELPKRPGDPGVTVSSKDGTVYLPGDLTYPDGPRYGEALRAGHGGTLHQMYRVGKKAAGRELDGREHDEYPPT